MKKETIKIWEIIIGLILIAGGIFALVYPFVSSVVIEMMIGALLMATGLIQLFLVATKPRNKGYEWNILTGVINLLGGAALLVFPIKGLFVLSMFFIAYFFIIGAIKIAFGFVIRPFRFWWTSFLLGLLTIIMGAILLILLPGIAFTIFGVLIGIELILNGVWIIIS